MTGILIRRVATAALFVSASALAGCATTSARPPVIALDDPPPAIAATPRPSRPARSRSSRSPSRCRSPVS
jgi:type IV secretion system protein VirB9